MKFKKPKRTDEELVKMLVLRMKELRSASGHSQEYVVAQTGLDIFHFESGDKVPTIISLTILCKFYGITLGEFFTPLNYPAQE